MNIIIAGASLTGNKGASAMCLSVISALKNQYGENVNIGLLSPKPEFDRTLANELDVKLFNYRSILRTSIPNYFFYKIFKKRLFIEDPVYDGYVWADVIIDIHGINFSDSDSLVSTAVIPSAQIFLSHLLDVPIIKFTQTFGPMNRIGIRFFARLFLPLVSNIFPREKSAYDSLQSLGLENIEPVSVDSAFLLPSKAPETLKHDEQSSIKRVAFIPNAILLSKSKNYIEVCNALILKIISEGYKAVIIMHYSKPTSDEDLLNKSSNNDYQLIQNILKNMNNSDSRNIEVYAEEYSSSELKGIIGTCDLSVPSRYHALVASISQEIPSFCIGWAGKYEGLLVRVGLKRYSFKADKYGFFDMDDILINFKYFLDEYFSGELSMGAEVAQLSAESNLTYNRLFQIIDDYAR